MTQVEQFSFKCKKCGEKLFAKSNQAGHAFQCKKCGEIGRVPTFALVDAEVEPLRSPQPTLPDSSLTMVEAAPPLLPFGLKVPTTFGELVLFVMIFWTVLAVTCLIMSFVYSPWGRVLGILFFLSGTGLTVYHLWTLIKARQQVLHHKDVSLFWGLVRLVAWDPTEGVLMLRNKSVAFSDDNLYDSKGDIKFIYPVLGEELALRVPLEIQTLRFADEKVLTKEYLNLSVRGTIKWRIVNVRQFYLLVSREIRTTTDSWRPAVTENASVMRSSSTNRPPNMPDIHGTPFVARAPEKVDTMGQLLRSTIEWLRSVAEEQTKIVVSGIESGLLLKDRLELPELRSTSSSANAEFGGATTGLAETIRTALMNRVDEYGLTIADVSLQEIQFPQEVLDACSRAARAAYRPFIERGKASATREKLRAEADVVGKEAVSTKHILEHAPGYTVADFLTEFVKKGLATPGANIAAGAVVGQAIADKSVEQRELPSE